MLRSEASVMSHKPEPSSQVSHSSQSSLFKFFRHTLSLRVFFFERFVSYSSLPSNVIIYIWLRRYVRGFMHYFIIPLFSHVITKQLATLLYSCKNILPGLIFWQEVWSYAQWDHLKWRVMWRLTDFLPSYQNISTINCNTAILLYYCR
jgi:hypothetical protein